MRELIPNDKKFFSFGGINGELPDLLFSFFPYNDALQQHG